MALLFSSPVSRLTSTPFLLSSKPVLPQIPTPPLLHRATGLPNAPKPFILTTRCPTVSQKPPGHPLASSTDAYFPDIGEDLEAAGEIDESSPWEGAVVYRRDPTTAHLEYATTLERLGLCKLSSELSRTRAADMGMRVVFPRRKEGGRVEEGTPVLVSVDVTRKKRKLRLDGIVRTVITLACNRCAQPAAEAVFSNFTLMLTEDPVEETDELVNMGTIYGDKSQSSSLVLHDEDEDESFIDPDDRLHFPSEDKEIDISKQIRDIVHLEITINTICGADCKGLCLKCGTDLNKGNCNCGRVVEQDDGEYGPLKSLKKQMQKR